MSKNLLWKIVSSYKQSFDTFSRNIYIKKCLKTRMANFNMSCFSIKNSEDTYKS